MRKIFKNPFIWAFFIGIISLHIVKEMALFMRKAPEPMVIVPDWSLINQDGKPLAKSDLKGKIVIADFFFTSCPSICPMLTKSMKDVYERLQKHGEKVAFLSISVDPEIDSPAVLKDYMTKNNINYNNWYCLTGSKKDIYDTVIEKMKVHVGERQELNDGLYDIPHMAHLALFDQEGNLRGLFKTDAVELSALVRAANFLLEK
jgi:protein SCO1/2